ncbi:MAG: insulinase family protein [Thermodesulfobacteriota bacterium]|nr:insulinase family protein [Thermodesulfobacteriota bacterium]
MSSSLDSNNTGLNKGDRISGYLIKRIVTLKEIHSFFYELEHTATKAKHVHISNNDSENTFSVAFKTVPTDSTGVAHILEHTVLCGSRKFQVRDPFFSMLKRSLSTFMNAFTASDWTMYPFSTQNRKDFYNLMDVYLDAAFFPNIKELSFMQEGHRLELEGDDPSSLVYKGVVYNEMKGAMSSPDQIMARSLLKALYASSTYRYNSGGNPPDIVSLTYEQLKSFHKRHYHPSNSFFYTYGDLPLAEHLSFIENKILKAFKFVDPNTTVDPEPRRHKPEKKSFPYPLGKNEDPKKKCQVSLAWLMVDVKDNYKVLALTLLEQILLGNAASPLHRALIESKLGSALSDQTGFDANNRDTLFSCGLKDVEQSNAEKIESIILDVLNSLVTKGVDKKLIESAIHQLEFHRKEVTNTPYPYGIKLLLTFSASWFHGGDPVKTLQFDADLKRIKNALVKGPFFENLIKEYFVENPHRVLLTLVPDQLMEQKEAKRVEEKLKHIRSVIPPDELGKILENTKQLKKLQESIEDVSSLPTLEIKDIPPSIQEIKQTAESDNRPAACYNQPTSGIFYLSAAVATGAIKKELIPFIPFFCFAIPRIGTAVRDYSEMARRIDAYTGGIVLSAHARTCFDKTGSLKPFVSINGKSLTRNQAKMFDIIEELLFKHRFSDLSRLKSLLLEFKAGLESAVIQNGHRLAISAASRNLSPASNLSEIWGGIHQLKAIKRITKKLSNSSLESISNDLLEIAQQLFTRDNLVIALIGENDYLTQGLELLNQSKELSGINPGISGNSNELPDIDFNHQISREGWSTSSAVSFVAQTFSAVRMQHQDAPALSVISKILRSMYLHREIREKGGAYGGFALYNAEDGLFSFASYRDPHIVATLNTYKNAFDFIKSGNYTAEDIKESILQVCSEIDKPDPPGPAAKKAFFRKIISLSDDMRRHFKERLLGLTKKQVTQAAEKYFSSSGKNQAIAVISGEDALKAANKKLSGYALELYRI